MKKLSLFCAFVLALTIPMAMSAQAPTVDQGSLTAKQLAAVIKAVKNHKPSNPLPGQLKAYPSAPVPAAGDLPAIIPGLVTVGAAQGALGDAQPTPCFGCLTTTSSPDTFGLALPIGAVPAGTPLLQFVETFDNQTYNNLVTLSLVVLNGDTVLSVSAVSGFIYPSIWSVYYLVNTPTVTGSKLTGVAVITTGVNQQINQVKSMPFFVQGS
jgi:hypothetical protein